MEQHTEQPSDLIFTWRGALIGLVAYLVVALIIFLVFIK